MWFSAGIHKLSWVVPGAVLAFGAAAADGTVLCDFESAADVAAWQLLPPGAPTAVRWNTDAAKVGSGGGSLELATEAAGVSGQRWPGAILGAGAMKFVDWRAYDTMTFTAVNPASHPVKLQAMLTVANGTNETGYFDLAPGRNTVTWTLPAIARDNTVLNLRFFQNDPTEAVVVYLDDITLAAGAGTVARRGELARKLDRLAALPELDDPELQAEVRRLREGVAASAARPLEESAVALVKLQEQYGKLETGCYGYLQRRYAERWRTAFPGSPWGYGVTHGTRKIFRDTIPFDGAPGGTVELELARREAEAAQVVLFGARAVSGVRWQVSELVDAASGARISSTSVRVMPVGYVDSPGASYAVEDHVRWRPDPLLGFLDTFDLDAEVWQPLWVEVKTGADTPAGEYRGTLTVTGDGVPALNVPMTVKVWNFTLPLRQSLANIFTYEANDAHRIYAANDAEFEEFRRFQRDEIPYEALSAGAKRLRDLEIATENLLLDHRVSPSSLYQVTRPPRVEDVRRWIERGAACFNIFYVYSVPWIASDAPYPADARKRVLDALDAAIPQYRDAGLLQYAVIYGFDEIGRNQFNAARDILGEIKRRYPGIPIVTTAFDESFGQTSGLAADVDVWCPLSPVYVKNLDRIRERRNDGLRTWYYTCCSPLPPSLNLLLEQPAVAPRLLLGARAWQYGVDGYLYYQTTLWVPGTKITRGPLTDHNGRSAYFAFNGDGMVLYPGPDGPLASIRLKMVRDGLEDYEYLVLLDALRRDPARLRADERRELDELLEVSRMLPGDLEHYDGTGTRLLEYRRRIGDFLDRHSR